MNNNSIILLVIVVVGVIVLASLVKKFAKAILLFGVVYVIFHIVFIWDGKAIIDNVIPFLKTEYQQKATDGVNDFIDKRNSNGVIDTEVLDEALDTLIKKAIDESKNQIDKIDKKKLIEDINKKIQDIDPQEAAKIMDKLQDKLNEYVVNNQTPARGGDLSGGS